MENHTTGALRNARKLRRAMSLPEGMLWHRLRQRPSGLKFRNQHPIDRFVVDFYCAKHHLVVEIDGIVHDMGNRSESDRGRDAWLRAQRYDVVRIAARDVLRDADEVAQSLVAYCAAKPPPSAAGAAATSPRGGVSSGAAV